MYHREGGNGIELLPYSTEPPAWPSVSQDGRYVYFHRFIGNILPYGASDATLGDYQLRRLDLHTGSISKVTAGKQDSKAVIVVGVLLLQKSPLMGKS